MARVTQAEIAGFRGVSRQAVHNAVKKGLLVLEADGSVDMLRPENQSYLLHKGKPGRKPAASKASGKAKGKPAAKATSKPRGKPSPASTKAKSSPRAKPTDAKPAARAKAPSAPRAERGLELEPLEEDLLAAVDAEGLEEEDVEGVVYLGRLAAQRRRVLAKIRLDREKLAEALAGLIEAEPARAALGAFLDGIRGALEPLPDRLDVSPGLQGRIEAELAGAIQAAKAAASQALGEDPFPIVGALIEGNAAFSAHAQAEGDLEELDLETLRALDDMNQAARYRLLFLTKREDLLPRDYVSRVFAGLGQDVRARVLDLAASKPPSLEAIAKTQGSEPAREAWREALADAVNHLEREYRGRP